MEEQYTYISNLFRNNKKNHIAQKKVKKTSNLIKDPCYLMYTVKKYYMNKIT